MKKAVFLDRDGVIHEDFGYVYKKEDFCFKEGIFEFCRHAREADYLIFIVTNQAGIARGYYTEDNFNELTRWMLQEFKDRDIDIDKVYYCPYHPTKGIGNYKQESFNRKPNPGMLLQAKEEFDIDLVDSILVGDKESDMESGRSAGIGKLFFVCGRYEIENAKDVRKVTDILDIVQYL